MNKALLIGINEYATVGPNLRGCKNDVEDMKKLLMGSYQVNEGDITQLEDQNATRQGIVAAIQKLLADAKMDDHLYIHFSGHGAQMDTNDPNEPDWMDEVLCPHDFDWDDPKSAIRDDDLRELLSPLPNGAAVTVTVDACHSGDYSRALVIIRTPNVPPARFTTRLRAGGGVHRLRSTVGTSTFVSACQPWQTAKDASFDRRPAGAFTHYFTEVVGETPNTSLSEIIVRVASRLARYDMTPVIEGVSAEPYAAPPRQDRALARATISAPRRDVTPMTPIWENCWTTDIFGQRGDVDVSIALSGNEIVARVRTQFFGGGEWHVVLNGNMMVPLDLAFGIQLRLTVRDFSLVGRTLRLQLSFDIYARFIGTIPIGTAPISVDLGLLNRDVLLQVPQSAADFMALVNLNANPPIVAQLTQSPAPVPRDATARIVYMASGEEGWGPNWREDRAVIPQQRADSVRRYSVVLDPVRGGGHAEFVRWRTDDEFDPSFVMHIGNGFFGGWGSVRYTVQGMYARDEPFPT